MTTEQGYIDGDWIYDLETYPNCFLFCIVRADGKHLNVFEVSDRKNETGRILDCLRYLMKNNQRMVGFNNLGFDYPIIHHILENAKISKSIGEKYLINASDCYDKAQEIIDSMRGDGFGSSVRTADEIVEQVDLYKIWHFDNKAKSTSLKMLEFNMKSDNIEDLPFPVGKILTHTEMQDLADYNKHDVLMTLYFYKKSIPAMNFRRDLGEKYGRNFTNHNDTKIGKDYFIMRLEDRNPESCYKMVGKRRVMNQSKRKSIAIGECLFDYYDFKQPAFIAVLEWFKQQTITETKGVFSDIPEHLLGDVALYAEMKTKRKRFSGKPTEKQVLDFKKQYPMGWVDEQELKATEVIVLNGEKVRIHKKSYWACWNVAETLNVVIDGFRFDFGTGGIHGSLDSTVIRQTESEIIVDWDVASMYPNIAIANRIYPEHLGELFCDIYKDVYNQRKMYPKGSAENAVMKLALNGVYGDSNNQYSPFYDPKYTMSVTINGQLSLCLLAEKLLEIEGLTLIQCNTDGVTAFFDKKFEPVADEVCSLWEKQVGLDLEKAEYKTMFIRDVNNYICEYNNGGLKRKGAYEYEGLGWHQNHSALVIPKAAEAAMLHGIDVETFIRNHKDKYDFMLRTKVPRSSSLVLVTDRGDVPLQNICRYYPCKNGGKLVKLMPPLENSENGEMRRLGIDVDWNVKPCNDITKFTWDIDYDYYIEQANKLVIS